ncbi:Cell cycle serine/threonine-protein kinase cdc5/MSD2 [Boothiomyces sp. JEL0838]|nr:Cell cycle serine/threonine-protein kinase cdc5/MSD2 [Boothiomyces sp. JEL0838]
MESVKEKPEPPKKTIKRPPTPPLVIKDKQDQKHFKRLELLGQGGFAKCFKVQNDINTYACKVVYKPSLKTQKQRSKLLSEIKIHKHLIHPNICRFVDCFEDEENVYIILELCTNKTFVDLLKRRKRLVNVEVRFYMWQLLDGIRDIKLGNLFLDENMNLQIGDFGLAAVIENDGDRRKTVCGTPNYIAPEILFDTKNGHSFEVDTWSAGIVMYTLIIGQPPFQTKEVKAIYKKIRDNLYEFPPDIHITENAKFIITGLLHTKPECRPSIDEVMNHQFFKEYMPKSIPVSALTTTPAFPDEIPIDLDYKPIARILEPRKPSRMISINNMNREQWRSPRLDSNRKLDLKPSLESLKENNYAKEDELDKENRMENLKQEPKVDLEKLFDLKEKEVKLNELARANSKKIERVNSASSSPLKQSAKINQLSRKQSQDNYISRKSSQESLDSNPMDKASSPKKKTSSTLENIYNALKIALDTKPTIESEFSSLNTKGAFN